MSNSVSLEGYVRVARAKILQLTMKYNCIGIIDSTAENVTISFYEDKKCTVDKWGKVEWL